MCEEGSPGHEIPSDLTFDLLSSRHLNCVSFSVSAQCFGNIECLCLKENRP